MSPISIKHSFFLHLINIFPPLSLNLLLLFKWKAQTFMKHFSDLQRSFFLHLFLMDALRCSCRKFFNLLSNNLFIHLTHTSFFIHKLVDQLPFHPAKLFYKNTKINYHSQLLHKKKCLSIKMLLHPYRYLWQTRQQHYLSEMGSSYFWRSGFALLRNRYLSKWRTIKQQNRFSIDFSKKADLNFVQSWRIDQNSWVIFAYYIVWHIIQRLFFPRNATLCFTLLLTKVEKSTIKIRFK